MRQGSWHTGPVKGTALAIAVSALVVALPAVAAESRPALRLVSSQPLVVQGVHFRAHERIRVTAYVEVVKHARVVRATAAGRFKASFDLATPLDPCLESLRVTAVGARGSEAVLKLPQRACPPSP
jgi:hypothetical protein